MRSRSHDKEDRGGAESKRRQKASPRSNTGMPREPIAGDSAKQGAQRHCDERKHGIYRARLQVKAAHLVQIDIEPAEVNPRHVAVGEITGRQGNNFLAATDSFPRRAWSAIGSDVRCRVCPLRVASAADDG